MSKEILKQRIQILREPLETWLTFYGKEGKTLNEEQLISDIIIKITNYREYSYKQNREFEKLLNKKLTWKNEEHNDKNWKEIITIYNEKMPQVMKLLGKTYEDHGFEENWNILHNQSKNIAIKMINIKKLIEEITRTLESEKDIFEIIEDIMMYLQSTRLIYNDIDNWFKIVINRHDEEPQEKFQDNFKTTQNIITTLEEEILNQDDQIKNQQDQILNQNEQITLIARSRGWPIEETGSSTNEFGGTVNDAAAAPWNTPNPEIAAKINRTALTQNEKTIIRQGLYHKQPWKVTNYPRVVEPTAGAGGAGLGGEATLDATSSANIDLDRDTVIRGRGVAG